MKYELEFTSNAYWINNGQGRGTKILRKDEEDDAAYKDRAIKEFDEMIEDLKKKKSPQNPNVIKSAEV